jgi:hypothetical protein
MEVAMRLAITAVLSLAGAALLAAPEQTIRPGQMTEARVWIENRGRSEAVPMDLRDVNLDRPLKVEVMNGDPALPGSRPFGVVRTRQLWEYKQLAISPNADVIGVLNNEGAAGWETTGITLTLQDRTILILKRPR